MESNRAGSGAAPNQHRGQGSGSATFLMTPRGRTQQEVRLSPPPSVWKASNVRLPCGYFWLDEPPFLSGLGDGSQSITVDGDAKF